MKTDPFDKTYHHQRVMSLLIRGWTLIELLVVIAIIAVLTAIAVPVIMKVRAKADSALCVSHLKQLGGAMMMYASEHNDKLPPLSPEKNPDTGKRGGIWPSILGLDVGLWDGTGTRPFGTGIWTCPTCDFMSNGYGGYGVVEGTVFAYGEKYPAGSNQSGSLRLNQIDNPAQTWLVGDACKKPDQVNKGWYGIWSKPASWKKGHGPAERHGGRVNVCMADGHVESLTKRQLEEGEYTINVTR